MEITDVNRTYLERGKLNVDILGRSFGWFDAGTPDSLLGAAEFVATLERRQEVKINCSKEIAFAKGFIDYQHLEKLAQNTARAPMGIISGAC